MHLTHKTHIAGLGAVGGVSRQLSFSQADDEQGLSATASLSALLACCCQPGEGGRQWQQIQGAVSEGAFT